MIETKTKEKTVVVPSKSTITDAERATWRKQAEWGETTDMGDGTIEVTLHGRHCGEHRSFLGQTADVAKSNAMDWADARKIHINW